jgi:iron complex transport system substrate-binding protein
LGTVEKAAPLLENMKARKEAVGKRIRTAQTAGKPVPKVLFVMSQIPGSNALMVAGSATGAQAMIEMAGGINAAYGFERYKQMGNEALAEADPDLVLFALSPHHGFRDAEALRRHPALRDGTAVREGRIHGVDLGNSLNFGSRLGEAVEVWSALLHPPEDVKAAALAP